MIDELVYKVLRAPEWRQAQVEGAVTGSPDDLRDGFIHLSTRAQLAGTLDRHFAGETGLIILEVAADRLHAALTWEPSRDGAHFPHLYDVLPLVAVIRAIPVPSPDAAQLLQQS